MSSRSLVRPEGSPVYHYSHASHALKGEDVAFVCDALQRLSPEPHFMGKWDLFCVCDGHGGPEAAQFAKINLPALIAARLPKGTPPETETEEGQAWLQTVRDAVNMAFVQLDLDFRKERILPTVGCTATVVLSCGWILTVANVGDSEAFLDFGSGSPLEVTISHKIDTNLDEQIRLAKLGKEVRPLSEELFRPARSYEEGVGPLRVWPCGLAVSRAIGDYDCGSEVLASPHITQIKVPFAGARLTVASDGLWDHLTAKRVVKRSRKHIVKDVPHELISKAKKVSAIGLTDDTTVLVLDILPTAKTDFREVSRKLRGPKTVFSNLSKRIGGRRKKACHMFVLATQDMAPDHPAPYPSLKSFASAGSSKDLRPSREHHFPVRSNTFTSTLKQKSDSESQEDDEEKGPGAEGLSMDLDGVGPSRGTGTSLRRFRSSMMNYRQV